MGRKKVEEILDVEMNEVLTPITKNVEEKEVPDTYTPPKQESPKELVSCLRNERIVVRYIMNAKYVENKKHVLYGGIAENAVKAYTVPLTQSGMLANVLTESERMFLESIMGLEPNTLSIYKKVDNFWDNFQVKLGKRDTFLDLRSPEDYIKYKVLLVNKDFIADSIKTLEDRPKATYKYVLIAEAESQKSEKRNMSATMEAYKLFGKLEEDRHTLRVIAEMLTQKSISAKSDINFIHNQINSIIQSNPKLFISVAKDEFLPYKVLIKRSVEKGLIAKRGNFFYIKEPHTPMCEDNEDPTLNTAARWISLPRNQELRFRIEAQLNER